LDLRDLILLYITTIIIEQDEIITNYYLTIDQLQYAGNIPKIKIIYIKDIASRSFTLGGIQV